MMYYICERNTSMLYNVYVRCCISSCANMPVYAIYVDACRCNTLHRLADDALRGRIHCVVYVCMYVCMYVCSVCGVQHTEHAGRRGEGMQGPVTLTFSLLCYSYSYCYCYCYCCYTAYNYYYYCYLLILSSFNSQ
jgi:hypothetical protein